MRRPLPDDISALLVLAHEDGYRGRPGPGSTDDSWDAAYARAESCSRCQRRGMSFMSLTKPGRVGFIGVRWCPACMYAEEV
jgi:hypothetical protein